MFASTTAVCCLGGFIVMSVLALVDHMDALKEGPRVVERTLNVWLNLGSAAELSTMWDKQGKVDGFEERSMAVRKDSLARWGKFKEVGRFAGQMGASVGSGGSVQTFRFTGSAMFEKGEVPMKGTLVKRENGQWKVFALNLGQAPEKPGGQNSQGSGPAKPSPGEASPSPSPNRNPSPGSAAAL